MKNLFKKCIISMLAIVLALASLSLIACGEKDGDTKQTTGKYEYRVEKGTKQVAVMENGSQKVDENGELVFEEQSYSYYVITGYEVSSDDALKMADGDYTGIKAEHRNITIPTTGKQIDSKLSDYPVEEIEAAAFTNQVILQSVVVGDNIKKIGQGAFGGCTNLKSLTLPFVGESEDATNEKRLLAYIFGGVGEDGAEGVVKVDSKINEFIGDDGNSIMSGTTQTFYVPSSLEEVTIVNENITSITACSFYGLSMLKKVNIPANVKEIDSHAFAGCSALTTIDLSNIEVIYQYGFSNCTSLTKLNFGTTPKIEKLFKGAFSGCTNLGKNPLTTDPTVLTLKLPVSLKEMGKNVFAGCTSLIYVDLTQTDVLVIENSAFNACTSLKGIKVNDGTVVKSGAFSVCPELTEDAITGNCTLQAGAFDQQD